VKRFCWRLQKLLDVKVQTSRAMRTELAALTQRIAALQRDIAGLRWAFGESMRRLAGGELSTRIAVQEVFVARARFVENRVTAIRGEIGELTRRRAEKIAEFMRLRAERQTLEKMRRRAHRQYVRRTLAEEQKLADEASQIKFTAAAPDAPPCMIGA